MCTQFYRRHVTGTHHSGGREVGTKNIKIYVKLQGMGFGAVNLPQEAEKWVNIVNTIINIFIWSP